MKKILLSILLIIPMSVFAQDIISIGSKHAMFSKVLDEERPYWIYLPPNYDNNKFGKAHYPVIYLLDGDTNFSLTVGIHQSFTRGMYNTMPECIIVGIPNTDRSRDLTPTKSSLIRDGKEMFTKSGGGENFTMFLAEELMPLIDNQYRTNGYNILIGHSFGGLLGMNTLLHHTTLFNAYILLDPSFWWDNKLMYREAEETWSSKNFKGRSLYIAMARDKDKDNDPQKHSNIIGQFCENILFSAPQNGIKGAWKYYENEDHGSILIPGIYDALRELFKGITLPVKKLPKHPELIKIYYKQLSERLGHTFIPDEEMIDNIGNYVLSTGNIESALEIFEYNLQNYPDSPNALSRVNNTKTN